MNIVVLDAYVNNPGDLSWKQLEAFGSVTLYDRTAPDEVAFRVADANIAVSNKITWDEAALDAAPNLELIALTSTGFNVVDLDAAQRRGVTVCNVPAYSTPDVAQMTFALLLELCLHVGAHSRGVMNGEWVRSIDFSYWDYPLVEIAGKTLGIVGMGSIGQAVARVANAFGMDVLFNSRSAKPACENEHGRQVGFDELLARADIVTLHAPATPETNGLIDAAAIAKMKDGAMLLNTARGTLVDERAVADALIAGKLSGFGADVVAVEPMTQNSPLLDAKDKNIVITPHIAWATHEARTRLLDTVFANIRAFIEGHPQNVVS